MSIYRPKKLAQSGIAVIKNFGQAICSLSSIVLHLQSFNSIALFGETGTKRADKLLKRPNRAARVLTLADYDAGAWQLFESVIENDLSTQRDIQKTFMVFKSLNCQLLKFQFYKPI